MKEKEIRLPKGPKKTDASEIKLETPKVETEVVSKFDEDIKKLKNSIHWLEMQAEADHKLRRDTERFVHRMNRISTKTDIAMTVAIVCLYILVILEYVC